MRLTEEEVDKSMNDELFRKAYGKDWERVKKDGSEWFQRHYGYEKANVLYWQWSPDFNRWGAVVKFTDGQELYTFPKRKF